MSGPERLLLGGATDFERSLLRAVLDERPSPELTLRMEQALGLGVGALPGAAGHTAAGHTAAGHTATGQGAGHAAAGQGAAVHVAAPSLAAKAGIAGVWLKAGVGALVGAGLVASGVVVQSQVTSAPSAPIADQSVRQANDVETLPVEAVAVEAVAVHNDALREEIVLLDAARAASSRRDLHRARELLERYRREFPHGALEREARVLWRRSGAGPWPSAAPAEVRPAEPAGSEDTPRR